MRLPPHSRRAKIAPGIQPDQPQRRAMPLCHQTEPARGGEAQRAGIAGKFPDNKSQLAAAQPLLQRKQRIFGSFRGNMDQPVSQRRGQSGTIGPPTQPQCGDVLNPQPTPLVGAIGSRIGGSAANPVKRQRKCQRRAAAFAGTSKHLTMEGRIAACRFPARKLSKARRGSQKGGSGRDLGGHANRLYVLSMFSFAAIRKPSFDPKKRAVPFAGTTLFKPTAKPDQSSLIPPGSGATGCGGIPGSSSCTSTRPRPTWLRLRL